MYLLPIQFLFYNFFNSDSFLKTSGCIISKLSLQKIVLSAKGFFSSLRTDIFVLFGFVVKKFMHAYLSEKSLCQRVNLCRCCWIN